MSMLASRKEEFTKSSLTQLLEQSRQLTHPMLLGQELPVLERGVETIELLSRKLAEKSTKQVSLMSDAESDVKLRDYDKTKGYRLLASKGFDAEKLQKSLNAVDIEHTFEPLEVIQDTDVESYLRHEHEMAIVAVIEEARKVCAKIYSERIHQAVESDWAIIKKTILDELLHSSHVATLTSGVSGDNTIDEGSRDLKGRATFSTGTSRPIETSTPTKASFPSAIGTPVAHLMTSVLPKGNVRLQSRMLNYAQIVAKLNDHRISQTPFPLVSAFEEVARKTSLDGRDQQVLDSWDILKCIVDEEGLRESSLFRGEFEHVYYRDYSDKMNETGSINLRKKLIDGSRRYLEKQFLKFIELSIAQFPRESQLGGRPSIEEKIRAFLNVRYAKSGGIAKANLELVGDKPIWAIMYYCMRCGEWKKALDVAREYAPFIQRLDSSFMTYFNAYIENADRKLPRAMKQQILAEYSQISRYLRDPFKLAVYKIIGRCDLSKKSIPEVIQVTEDYLWLQLTLIREDPDEDESLHERYTLRDLQDLLLKFGPDYFNSKNNPLTYFQVLLLSANFENAIAYLYNSDSYSSEAIHYAICLSFYGLLLTGQTDVELVSQNHSGAFSRHRVDFNRMIIQYTRFVPDSDPLENLHYLFVLSVDKTPEQSQLCYGYIRDVIFETKEYAVLLGEIRADGNRIPGFIEKYIRLLGFDGKLQEFLNEFVEKTATRCEESGLFEEAIQLHNLSQNYDAVVDILNSYLGSFISGNQVTKSGLAPDQLFSIARSIHEYYASNPVILHRLQEPRWRTYEILIVLQEFFDQYHKGHLDSALAILESLNLLPLDVNRTHATHVSEKAEKFRLLDGNITKNLSDILLATMDILSRVYSTLKESPYVDSARQTRMTHLKQQARLLMTFAGMVQYRMPQETYARLSKLDIYMS